MHAGHPESLRAAARAAAPSRDAPETQAVPARHTFVHEGRTIAYAVVRSSRRRRTVQIFIDAVRGVVVAAPAGLGEAELRAVVERRGAWIARHTAGLQAETAEPPSLRSGGTLPYRGREIPLEVIVGPGNATEVQFFSTSLRVTVPARRNAEEHIRRAIARWYGTEAQALVGEAIDRWAPLVSHRPATVLIRNQRRRWGSCSPSGVLRFNWRLAMLGPDLMDYVVVHELCHLAHLNHSESFWNAVLAVLPDARARRSALAKVRLPEFV